MVSTIFDTYMRELFSSQRIRVFSAALIIGMAAWSGSPLAAQVQDPRQLVKDAVSNELRYNEQQTDFWMYRLNKENKSGAQVKDMVETKDGIVARLISVNGRPLTPEERAADDERLTALANNPEEQRSKLEDQKKEQEKVLAMVRALPDALLYEYAGTDLMDGRPTVRLKFKPNPAFHPTTRETIAYKATEGTLWIDSQEQRILRLDATLAHDINIGWGIVGHIDKGGQLFLQQQFLGPRKWRINKLIIEASGQAFFFRSISLKQRQFGADFRPVSPDLSIAAAVNLLKKMDATVAAKQRP